MVATLRALEELPRRNASQVKNKWGEVVRLVQESGSIAVTNHATVEMVLLNAAAYRGLVQDVQALQAREAAVLDELGQRFEARLAVLQQDGAARQVNKVLAAKGRLGQQRPKAGASY